jgi:hypothetical protein
MPYCPIWRWYVYPGSRELDYAINSAITGSIERVIDKGGKDTGLVNIATDNLKESGQYLQCAVTDAVKDILEKEAKGQTGEVQHYGLIIVRPGKEKLSDSEVVDFISFHRDPRINTKQPTASRNDITAYNTVFEKLVLEQQPSTRPPVEAGV